MWSTSDKVDSNSPAATLRHRQDISSVRGSGRGSRFYADSLARAGRWLGAILRRAPRHVVPPRSDRADDGLSILAHELRTPLCAIRSAAEILRDEPDMNPSERSHFVAMVLAEEARLEALVLAMLDASSLEQGQRNWRVRLKDLRLNGHEQATRAT